MEWTKDKANAWLGRTGWLVGFNYVPSTAINSTEMWQASTFDPETIERELAAAQALGYNSLRVFLQYIVWADDESGFYARFDQFLDIAKAHGMSVMPILFDDCAFALREPTLGPQGEPRHGIHNSGWTSSPGFVLADDPAAQDGLKRYVQDMIGRYATDARIIVWDLYNEPGNCEREAKSVPLLKSAFAWAREVSPTQPLTAGVWSWNDYDMTSLELSDVISFHDYQPIEQTAARIQQLQAMGRPILCTEWMHRIAGCTIHSHMAKFKHEQIGIYQWGLVIGRTQTNLSWNLSENNLDGQPAIWQHDVLRADLTPYRVDEIEVIKSLTK